MSEQYEPSYYEIALTGRQVLVAFVILLVCLVAAFFSGVWVGRGGPAGAQQIEARLQDRDGGSLSTPDQASGQAPAQAADQGASTPDGGKAAGATAGGAKTVPEQEGVGALSFFDEEADGGGGSKSAPAKTGKAATAPKKTKPEPPAEPPEKAAKPPDSTGRTPEAANPSGSLTGGDVVIQVFSSSDQAKAKEILDRLKANDFRAFISPVTDDGRTLYRVRVGPFEHQDDAERVAAELRRRLDLDTWITR